MSQPSIPDTFDGNAGEASLGKPTESYVAFAFAAADLLMEVTSDGHIVFAIGAAMALLGRPARLLANMPLEDIFIDQDRPRIAKVLKRMSSGTRVRHTLLTIRFPGGDHVPVAMSGYPHPDHHDHLLCVLTHGGTLTQAAAVRGDGELLDKRGFETLAQNMLQESSDGGDDNYKMTFLDFPELVELRKRVGAVKTAEFINRFTDYLRQCSVGGDAVGELGNSRYGVIHSADVSSKEIENTIQQLVQSVVGASEDKPIGPASKSMDLDTSGISSQEAAQALAMTISAFASDESSNFHKMVSETKSKLSATVDQMREVKELIDSGDFDLFVQPIVDLWNNAVHHYECLVRFRGRTASPYETITFAENVGLVGDLDCAILERAIAFMRSPLANDPALKFAVNMSGRSISSSNTAARLLRIMNGARDLRGRLLFEVTESAEIADLVSVNALIQEIRGLGFPVGLDDFGAGSAAFHYLRALKVDHVKIDGSYIKDLQKSQEAVPYIRAISQLCRDLDIATVAEHIENEQTVNLLKVYNVRYGQGYHFGKPAQPTPHKHGPKAAWMTGKIRWRNGLLVYGTPAETAETAAS